MRTRTLSLKKETLAELSSDDLALVVGAQAVTQICASDLVACVPTNRCTLRDCVVTLGGCATSLDIC